MYTKMACIHMPSAFACKLAYAKDHTVSKPFTGFRKSKFGHTQVLRICCLRCLCIAAHRNCKLRYMPVWNLKELEKCRQRLYRGVTAEEMLLRFSWFGGTIRTVLAKVQDPPQRCIERAMPSLEMSVAVLRALGGPVGRANFSHMLGHIVVSSKGSGLVCSSLCLSRKPGGQHPV
jgi:hypothetical protein